jgi:heme-degrading monooxygenase HmoA
MNVAVLITVTQPGGSPQEAERFRALLHETIRTAPGFIFHVDGPLEGGWQIVNAWESRTDFERWFHSHVKPNLRGDQALAVPTISDLAHVVLR